jgi:beta-xylosidase
MLKRNFFIALIVTAGFMACTRTKSDSISNPLIAGYFADPSIVKVDNTWYIYATIDPWGGNELAVFETTDFQHFERKQINWPTKEACTSSTSGGSMVWAPSVIKALNGKFYMYVSVGSEVWVGMSEHPLGPWKNAKADNSPLIHRDYFEGYHMIDAEAFIDDDGQAYLYWGSGLNWVNGKCFAVKLSTDMVTFTENPVDITPPNFFEAPFMLKENGKYYLMYSDGKAIDETYKIRYSVGDTPFGPWMEGKNSPVLATDKAKNIFGPGHHSVFKENGQHYIIYHRIHPQDKEYVLRELCLDSLNFDQAWNIKKIEANGIKPL